MRAHVKPVGNPATFVASVIALAALGASATNSPPGLVIQDAPLNREIKAPISFAPVVRKVAPSVVNIYSTLTVQEKSFGNPLLNDPLLRRFFGDDFGSQGPARPRKARSLGSGVIVSPDGYILTANHVVEGADVVRVALLPAEKEFEAKVIGTDPPTDIAVLKIQARTNLPAVTIADSDKLEVGDVVLAVGNPFGVGQTVTMGIISALGRGGFGINGYEDFIQTDAAINPGNSGGALVDAEGRLVGINTAILSRTGGFQGVGFAVPMSMARYVMDRLVNSGKVTRGFLGVNIQDLTPELAKELNFPEGTRGVLIGGASPNSPAARAGLEAGDVITQFNGKPLSDSRNLQLMVAQSAPGTKVTVKVLRSEPGRRPEELTVTASLGELVQNNTPAPPARGGSGDLRKQHEDVLDGVEVTDLDNSVRHELDVPRSIRGAVVVNVDPNSSAAEAGLRPGDVILELNRQSVHSAQEAVSISRGIKGDNVLLRVWSKPDEGAGGTRYVVVENARHK
jgi:serine protease Do